MEQLFKAVRRNASARDCTHTVQDPVAVVISQGKQNNTGSASAACCHGLGRQSLRYLPRAPALSAGRPAGQVPDIISAEHCQHSTCLPSGPYSRGIWDSHYMTSSAIVPRSCLTLRLAFSQTSRPKGSDRRKSWLRAHPTANVNPAAYFHDMWKSQCGGQSLDLDQCKPPQLRSLDLIFTMMAAPVFLQRSLLIVTVHLLQG